METERVSATRKLNSTIELSSDEEEGDMANTSTESERIFYVVAWTKPPIVISDSER